MLRRIILLAVVLTVCGWVRPADAGNPHAFVPANPETTRRIATRYAEDVGEPASLHDLPLWVDFYQQLVRPSTPSYARPLLDQVASLATRRWRRLQGVQKHYKGW